MIFAESEASVYENSIQSCFSPVDVCCAKSLQSCPTLCDPLHCSPPHSSAHGNLQAGILEWVTVSCCRGSSRPRDWTRSSHTSCIGTTQGLKPQLSHLPHPHDPGTEPAALTSPASARPRDWTFSSHPCRIGRNWSRSSHTSRIRTTQGLKPQLSHLPHRQELKPQLSHLPHRQAVL